MFASEGGEAGNMSKEEFDLWPLLSSVAICEQGVKPHFSTLMAALQMDSPSLKIFKLSEKNVGAGRWEDVVLSHLSLHVVSVGTLPENVRQMEGGSQGSRMRVLLFIKPLRSLTCPASQTPLSFLEL